MRCKTLWVLGKDGAALKNKMMALSKWMLVLSWITNFSRKSSTSSECTTWVFPLVLIAKTFWVQVWTSDVQEGTMEPILQKNTFQCTFPSQHSHHRGVSKQHSLEQPPLLSMEAVCIAVGVRGCRWSQEGRKKRIMAQDDAEFLLEGQKCGC